MISKEEQNERSLAEKLKRLFSPSDIEEIRRLVKAEKHEERKESDGGENEQRRVPPMGPDNDDPERRQELKGRWEENMEAQADDNTKMIYENRELLERLDERSAWTMRLLVGVFVTIVGSAALQVFIL